MSSTYVAIAECPAGPTGTWWISFPSFPGVTTAADTPDMILPQALDALGTAVDSILEFGQALPPTIEAGGVPEYDLSDYERPLLLLVPSPEIARAA